MKVKSLRVLIIVTIFISAISIMSIISGIFIYNDMKKIEEASLDVSKTRKSLIKDFFIFRCF